MELRSLLRLQIQTSKPLLNLIQEQNGQTTSTLSETRVDVDHAGLLELLRLSVIDLPFPLMELLTSFSHHSNLYLVTEETLDAMVDG